VVILLGFPARGLLGEEHLSYLLEIVEQTCRQKIKPIRIRGHTFQTGQKGQAYERIITRVDHHLVSEMPDVLDKVADSGVVVKG